MGDFSSHSIDERHDAREENRNDVFEKQIADGTRGLIDIASHYAYTPERWRFYVDGQRQLLEYNSSPQYTHTEDTHQLSPNAGETITLETTDDVVYTVQYELALTWAFELQQSLESGDRIRVGMFDDQDGWFMEQNDTHTTEEADFVIRRNGMEVRRVTRELAVPTTRFARLRLRTAWYRITRQLWTQSYSSDGTQENVDVARTSAEPEKGPSKGNMPLRYEITAGPDTTDLVFEAGSTAAVLLGGTERITRAKNFRNTFSVTDTAGEYVPVVAFRCDPSRDIVRLEFTDTNIPKFTGSSDIYGLLLACPKEKVRDGSGNPLSDGDFSPPNELSGVNSVLETTTNVEQFPDSTGSVVTSAADPGGYQLGLATRYTSGAGGKITSSGTGINAKRVLADGDYAVLAVKTSSAGDFDYENTIEQDF